MLRWSQNKNRGNALIQSGIAPPSSIGQDVKLEGFIGHRYSETLGRREADGMSELSIVCEYVYHRKSCGCNIWQQTVSGYENGAPRLALAVELAGKSII